MLAILCLNDENLDVSKISFITLLCFPKLFTMSICSISYQKKIGGILNNKYIQFKL